MHVAIIAITANGARIGGTLQHGIPESRLFVIEKHATGDAHPFSTGVQPLVDRLWSDYGGFVFIMAAGIVVRTIAPLLQAKDRDPAVVVLDDAGRFAVSLLSGHIGGANGLAKHCAELIGSIPVITTATDANDLPSFDMLAQANGWLIEDLSRVKMLNALLLEGKEIAVVDCRDAVRKYCAGKGVLSFHDDLARAMESGASGQLVVSNRILPRQHGADRTLVLRPVNLCLGIGCNRGTSAEEIESVVRENLERLSLSIRSVKCIATARAKEDEAGLLEFGRSSGISMLFYESDLLNGVEVPSPPSAHAFAAIGARGVAEPAALLASQGGRLLLKKVKDGNVTLAIAEMDV
ncbi:MAG: cobalt-precorrin 5A hydrolase [Geobacteraceae bacterium GWC2_58_44]|nr:MAG: cobalt-precorrin 5A hydrolase [Geobacteraceae bacterium GWC2_58_44]HBG06159.1 cobalt-precorrin 5A hydrolase [Geobacter sp.]